MKRSLTGNALNRVLETYLLFDLKKHFHRVAFVGDPPSIPPNRPVVLYANHHNFYDGHIAWLVHHLFLDGEAIVWMREWDRVPVFAPLGAHPFPKDNSARRLRTIRTTVERLQKGSCNTLIYFPEGGLKPAETGIAEWAVGEERMFNILKPAVWLPLAIHVTWRDHPKPVVFLSTGASPETGPDELRERLSEIWQDLRSGIHLEAQTLLGGRSAPSQRFDFSFSRSFFERFL